MRARRRVARRIDPRVRLDDARVAAHAVEWTRGDLLAPVEHDSALHETERGAAEVALDQHDRQPVAAQAADELGERRRLLRIQTTERLIEHDQLRPSRECSRDLEASLRLARQELRRPIRDRSQTDALEERQGLSVAGIAAASEPEEQAQWPCAVLPERHGDVLRRAQVLERPRRLEHLREARSGDLMGRRARDLAPVEDDASAVGRGEAGEAVAARGLPGAARPEEPEGMPLFRRERHAVERDLAAEALGEPDHLEDAHPRQREAGYCSQKPAAGSICSTTSIHTPAGSKRPKRRCPNGSSRSG